MLKKDFDPLAYIESAFLDKEAEKPLPQPEEGDLELKLPEIGSYLRNGHASTAAVISAEEGKPKQRFKRTAMSAPRPRRSKSPSTSESALDQELHSALESLPKMVAFLGQNYDDAVTANYYGGEFKESRNQLISRLLDPQLTLEDTSRLLGVCPATVRRYTNRGWLKHHRTEGGQRRFRLSDIVRFVESHGRLPE